MLIETIIITCAMVLSVVAFLIGFILGCHSTHQEIQAHLKQQLAERQRLINQ